MLLPLAVMAVYYYGERAARMVILTVLAAVVTEYLGGIIIRKKAVTADFDAVTIGMMIPLLLPASSPVWLPIVGAVFAVFAAKLPFGTARSEMFDPVSAGIAFLTICSKVYVFTYPAVGIVKQEAVLDQPGFVSATSLADMLYNHNSIGTNIVSFLDLWTGDFAGPMGATCGFALLAVAIGMLLRRKKALVSSLGFFAVVIIYAFLFPRVLTGRGVSVAMELSSGMLIFAALFLLTNPAILPKGNAARAVFGAVAGLICMLIRTFGVYEEGVCFAILAVDDVAPMFDKIKTKSEKQSKKLTSSSLTQSDLTAIVDSSFTDVGETPVNGGNADE